MVDLYHLNAEFRRRVLACRHPVNSGARSHKRQGELWWCRQEKIRTGVCKCPADGCNPANPPGKSWHEYDETADWDNPNKNVDSPLIGGAEAIAVDFDGPPYPSDRTLRENHLVRNIFNQTGREPWHAQPEEIPEASRVVGAWRRIKNYGPSSPVEPPIIITDPWELLFVPILGSS